MYNCICKRNRRDENDFIDPKTELKCKSLSFGDFGDDQKLLGPSTNTDALGFDSDGDQSSEWLSVDEGAIAVLSMDEIRNMKKM